MTDLEREHKLHKIIATSAFVMALCILPVAQQLIGEGAVNRQKNTGEVAGVSTDTSITNANVAVSPTPETGLSCQAQKEIDLANLERLNTGNKLAADREYREDIASYQEALSRVPANDRAPLQAIIDEITQKYNDDLAQLAAAVEPQKNALESRACPE